ncbi:MAG: acylneuraminate cytidylyltransferase family protein [Spirochaetes bacterium]|nr:acylneuraminate cytidylyltransferase family protein [Spirochaetota bacterium]
MNNNERFIAIIPARGGSKRIKGKNYFPLNGKPLISWTIESALKSKYIDKIIVTTDDEKIKNICERYNIIIDQRPSYLSTDNASTDDVILYIIKKYNIDKSAFIILLQPTSPLRNEKHIDGAIDFLINKSANCIISVCEVDYPLQWCNKLPSNLSMSNFIKKKFLNKRSQDLPKYYRLNGAIYICKVDQYLKHKTFFIKKDIYGFIMNREDSIDIDEFFDLKLAELVLKERINNNEYS